MAGVAAHYNFDDRRLRDHALRLFARALRNERMIALTGAMATEALGYYSWDDLAREVALAALCVARETRKWIEVKAGVPLTPHNEALLKRIKGEARRLKDKKQRKKIADTRVAFGILLEGFRKIAPPQLSHDRLRNAHAFDETYRPDIDFRRRIAQLFLTRGSVKGARRSAIKPLLESLGIRRFATLNYDFELERALMLRNDEAKTLVDGTAARGKLLTGLPREERGSILSMIGEKGSGRRIVRELPPTSLSRVMGDGLTVKSDVVDRERPDRLMEFAIGSSEVDRHILHLHGRADKPASMVIDIADYDERYRRDDLFRNPFEHGMRVLFAGNPILFVGLGMSEAEINDKLQYFVSNTPYRRMAPAFLIWNTLSADVDDPDDENQIAKWMADKRTDFQMRLGVNVIFDRDLIDRDDPDWGWRKPRSGAYKDHKFALDDAPFKPLWERFRALGRKIKLAEKKRDRARPARALVLADQIAELVQAQRALQLEALADTLTALPRIVAYTEAFSNRQGKKYWRTDALRRRLVPGACDVDQPVRLWGSPNLRIAAASRPLEEPQSGKKATKFPVMMLGVSASGIGRGMFGEQIAQAKHVSDTLVPGWNFHGTERSDRLLINAGFSYDSDSMLNAIAMFLQYRETPDFNFGAPGFCREEAFVRGDLFRSDKRSMVIINGIDRFFNFDGDPLSAEVDHLMRCILKHRCEEPQVQWLLLGTPRVARYFAALGIRARDLDPLIRKVRPGLPGEAIQDDDGMDEEEGGLTESRSRFLNWIVYNWRDHAGNPVTLRDASIAKFRHAKEIDTESVRRAFFAGHLSPITIRDLGIDCPTAFEILRTMAFIGIPMEGEVLLRAPRINAMLQERSGVQQEKNPSVRDAACRRLLQETINYLERVGLIIEIRPEVKVEATGLWVRHGLHRSVAAEMRERHGAPISDAKLSTAFNMSLFVAQPEDRYTPKRDFHEELGELVDRLTGAWHDVEERDYPHISADMLDMPNAKHSGWLTRPHDTKAGRYRDFCKLVDPSSAACLRVALAVVRGYYSTANLLTMDRIALDGDRAEQGALSEHADRIDRILRTFGHLSMARQNCREILAGLVGDDVAAGNIDQAEHMRLLSALHDEPWYPDDLVWLHNERAVIKLVQGHLYGARRSLTLAERINHRVEGANHGHNWRRIRMNMVALLIERGRLRRAQRTLDEIDWTIDEAPWNRIGKDDDAPPEPGERRTSQIRARFGSRDDDLVDMLSESFTREEIMMTGLTTAYRGLVAHMGGDYRTAEAQYLCGIAVLRRLGELRAYSIFQRHYAALLSVLGSRQERIREIGLAVVAADAIQQSDVAHRARILRASAMRYDPARSDENRRAALQDLREALKYASLSDSFRVRVEAGAALAREMRLNGDYETALGYASDALAIACRYGHSLQKIWLRIEIGQILKRRGDPKSGEALLDYAERSAVRTGYMRTIERINRARSQDFADNTER